MSAGHTVYSRFREERHPRWSLIARDVLSTALPVVLATLVAAALLGMPQ